MRTTNRHENFKSLYIPAVLQVEADVSRRFTLGLKGEVDFMLQRNNIAPKHLYYGLATVRYNFVTSGAQVCRTYYRGEIVKLLERINILQEDLLLKSDSLTARKDRWFLISFSLRTTAVNFQLLS